MINWQLISRVLGIMLVIFSMAGIPPLFVADIYHEAEGLLFTVSIAVNACMGFILWLPFRHSRLPLQARDGFLITVLFWLLLGFSGSLPFILMERPEVSVTDAIFESFSGLTTTGATILNNIDGLPRSLLFYRQQLQWLGGMGLVVLAVAILPSLRIGSVQLYRTEVPGPVKDSKLTPRIAETAKALWYVYTGLTVICILSYFAAGMSWFDAICHGFTTIAIGGFSTHNASLGYFHSAYVDDVAMIFMLISGMNFALHYLSWNRPGIRHYLLDPEFRGYIRFIVLGTILTVILLMASHTYKPLDSIEYGAFEFISTATTTGFSITGFSTWPVFLTQFLILASFIGCCSGSAGGGIKVIRVLLTFKQAYLELKRLIHPHGVFALRLGGMSIPERLGSAVWAFITIYVVLFSILYLALLITGIDSVTAFSSLASCMNNLGPALGKAAMNYSTLPQVAKWILMFSMLLGRLELFTLLILLTPAFWKR